MLKKALIICFVCCVLNAKAQLPNLKTNATPYAIERSQFYKEFFGKYDFIIGHQHVGGGLTTAAFYYNAIAFKGNKSYKIAFWRMKTFRDQPSANNETKIEPLNKSVADSIIVALNKNDFWSLEKDSLNYSQYTYYDEDLRRNVTRRYYKSHGLTDIFEIIAKDSFTIISCYEPEFLFEMIPQVKQRVRFINAKRAFLSIFPDVWQPPVKK